MKKQQVDEDREVKKFKKFTRIDSKSNQALVPCDAVFQLAIKDEVSELAFHFAVFLFVLALPLMCFQYVLFSRRCGARTNSTEELLFGDDESE